MNIKSITNSISRWQPITWLILGFSISYFLLSIVPVFMNFHREMQFYRYIPAHNPIGEDLNFTLRYTKEWLLEGGSPYSLGGAFPPITHLLFAPLVFVDDTIAYKIITYLTVICYFFTTLLIPVWISGSKQNISPIVFLFVTGLYSYGFQFELERGQFNIIAFFFCLLGIYLFHRHYRFRFLAYVLLSIAVQLKVYPAIFIVMFVKDWRDWRSNLRRLIGIGILNIFALFTFGSQIFVEFIEALSKLQLSSVEPWIGNHSITSFTLLYSRSELVVPYLQHWPWLIDNAWLLKSILLIFVIVCLFLIIYIAYRRNESGVNSLLLFGCTICALLFPSISHDYKLSLLPATMAIFFARFDTTEYNPQMRIISNLILLILSGFYSVTLFSYTNKPDYLFNNLPVLMIMLLMTAAMAKFQMNNRASYSS